MDLEFYIDIHAHSTLMNGFMYGNVYEDINRYERQAIFPKLLCQNAEDFSLANTNFNRDAVKAGTGRRYVLTKSFILTYPFEYLLIKSNEGVSPHVPGLKFLLLNRSNLIFFCNLKRKEF